MPDEHTKNKYLFKNPVALNRNSTNKYDESLLKT